MTAWLTPAVVLIAALSAVVIGLAVLIYIERDPFGSRLRYWGDLAVLPSVLLLVAIVWLGVFGVVSLWYAVAAFAFELAFLLGGSAARLLARRVGGEVPA